MLRLVNSTTTEPEETIIDTRQPTDYEARIREQQQRENAARAALESVRPVWAKALIVAELEHDASDSMTDYFNTTTSRIVALTWSRHTRDLFSELRKAAGTFPETAHLGPGCDRFTVDIVFAEPAVDDCGSHYYIDQPSHWHREIDGNGRTFTREADARAFLSAAAEPYAIHFAGKPAAFRWRLKRESVEHREKYSMGHGYYLKASGRYSTGWIVRKVDPRHVSGVIEHERLTTRTQRAAEPQPAEPTTRPGIVTITLNAERHGVEIRFPSKPETAVLDALKAAGWRWFRFSGCWYTRDTPDARAFAEQLTAAQV